MELEVDGIISTNLVRDEDLIGICDCGADDCCLSRDHYPRALFEFLDIGYGDHSQEEWESGYCNHYDYSLTQAHRIYPPSNGARWSDIMSDDRETSLDRYHKRAAEFRKRQYGSRIRVYKEDY